MLLVAERGDTYSAESVIELFNLPSGQIQMRLGNGRAHGTSTFTGTSVALQQVITAWLVERFAD